MTKNLMETFVTDREAFLETVKENFEGEPRTSWDNILDGVLAWFAAYCDDDASNWLRERYESGEVDTDELLWEFEQFLWGLEDINDYDEED